MITYADSQKWFLAIIILASYSVIGAETGQFNPVSPNDIPDILTMISNETQSNYDKIKIWQGKVDATIGIIYEGTKAERVFKNKTDGVGQVPRKVKRLSESTVEFAVNCDRGLFFDKKFYRSPLRYIDPNSGRVLGTKSIVAITTTIATPEYRITNVPFIKRKDVIITRKAVKEKRAFKESSSTYRKDIFDPRIEAIDGRAFRGSFLFLLNYIEKHGEFRIDGQSLRIEKHVAGTTTEYRIEIPSPQKNPGEFVFTTMIFNSDKGFNITLSETRTADGKLYNKVTWEYEAINGVFLPIRTMTQTFQGENAELASEKECIYTNLKLNQAIPEETFTYKNLGLQNGDKFIDKILDKEYTYQDGNLIPASINKCDPAGPCPHDSPIIQAGCQRQSRDDHTCIPDQIDKTCMWILQYEYGTSATCAACAPGCSRRGMTTAHSGKQKRAGIKWL